jgi:nucleoside-diphosphate-sugar epimerase
MGPRYSCALVTGGAGFIGSHIVDRLLRENFYVKVIDDLSTGRLDNIKTHSDDKNLLFVRGDIRDSETVRKALRDTDVVFHEAAFIGGPQSIERPMFTNTVNVDGTLNLLEASRESEIECFVLASSASVYGEQKVMPIKENVALHPSSPYAVSKRATELYAEFYYKTFGLETVCLRYFNVYGPRQPCGPYAAAITAFVDSLLHEKPPIIYGDGEQTRDFINVKDVVEANMLAAKKKCAGEIFNVASGSRVTINGLVKDLQVVMDKNHVKPSYAGRRPLDVYHSCGDIGKAREILGFEPKVTIRQGLIELVDYYKSFSNDA